MRIGSVLHRGQRTDQPYVVAADDLSRHTPVCGVTGAGKTTTVLWLLLQLDGLGVHYLVIEPVETEYRVLLTDETPTPRSHHHAPGRSDRHSRSRRRY